jgi:hypothetical protein
MASGWFGSSASDPTRLPDVRVQVAEQKPHDFYLQPGSGGIARPATTRSAASVPSAYVDTTHSKVHVHNASLFDVGILKDTLVPSLTLHSGLALIAYGAARYTNRVEAKDWLWPSGQVANAGTSVLSSLVLHYGEDVCSTASLAVRLTEATMIHDMPKSRRKRASGTALCIKSSSLRLSSRCSSAFHSPRLSDTRVPS